MVILAFDDPDVVCTSRGGSRGGRLG